MQIICDKCKAEIHPQPEMLRDGEIEYTFFAVRNAVRSTRYA